MNSIRYFKVSDAFGIIVAFGQVADTVAKVNATAINAACAVAAIYGLDPVKAVTAGKKNDAHDLVPVRKLKVREGESAFKVGKI